MAGFSCFVFIVFISRCYSLRSSYTAAVVNYLHIYADYPKELFKENVEQYVNLMRNASREYADIIVFPEYGLVDLYTIYSAVDKNITELEKYSSYIPEPSEKVVPCEDSKYQKYEQQLVEISCAARIHAIYTVINLPEKAINKDTGEMEFYNTNAILDKSGTVIAKFRKINLSEEPFFEPGTEIVTFTTDFNVTFGIFTCFDLLFQYPALDILSGTNVTDIIFPTAWYSKTPFIQGLSIQHGYAKSKGVNMLVSALQEPDNSDGGSAIYLSDGSIAEAFITNKRESRVLIHDVPIVKTRAPSTCETFNKTIKKSSQKEEFRDIDNFPLKRDTTTGYIYESLGKRGKTLTRVCTDNEDFCCIFNITVDNSSVPKPDYGHRITIYKGLTSYGSKILGGIRVCALVACLNETEESCGFRTNTSHKSAKFKSIEIQAVVDITNDTHNQPSTLKADLTPVSDYVYCETMISESKMKIKMAITSPQDSLVTFGIYGRMYGLDALQEDIAAATALPVEKGVLNL
ncbi:vanin-like protein 2 isoform X2 [Photinus pyralis]|uniref:CN hydrolase domain-containing protein n=1 Tax=Photinus pyralis TaxID=7054 RepID=A0A1Y1MVB2_PHOPY|nr:vanin-like protein 2 isoform X2 [Photinus pyralis]